jgi:hypothetical protein
MTAASAFPDAYVYARIMELVVQTEAGCWLWRGTYERGAPTLCIGSRHLGVRRWLYQAACGERRAACKEGREPDEGTLGALVSPDARPLGAREVGRPLCTRQACVAPGHTMRARRSRFGLPQGGGASSVASGAVRVLRRTP